MASCLIRDQNLSVHYNGTSVLGKSNAIKAQRKGGVGARKPLGDLSNSTKPSQNQAPKKPISKNLSIVDEEISATKSAYGSRNPLGDPSNSKKPSSNRGRKALTDISNSGKPHLHQAPKKDQKMKLSVLEQEKIHLNAIAEEQFLHNHQECIKAQTKAMDMDCFLKTVGLDFAKLSASQWVPPPVSSELKVESPMKYLELEQMAEKWNGDQDLQKHELSSSNLDSPPPCRSPNSPNQYVHWKDHENMNFMLMDTPNVPRHGVALHQGLLF